MVQNNLPGRIVALLESIGIVLRDPLPQAGTVPTSGGAALTVTFSLSDEQALSLAERLSPQAVSGDPCVDLGVALGEAGIRLGVARRLESGRVALVSMNEREVDRLTEALTNDS